MLQFKYTWNFKVVKFCSDNNIRIIYSASSSKFGNEGRDEHLSPYSWSKSKNIGLLKILVIGIILNTKSCISIMYTVQIT